MGWALSQIDGDGTFPRGEFTPDVGPYRAVAAQYGPCSMLIPSDETGTPIAAWCVVHTGSGFDAVAADADPRVRMLPDLPFDHVLTPPERNAIKNRANLIGVDTRFVLVSGDTVRQALRKLTDLLDTSWDPEAQVIS